MNRLSLCATLFVLLAMCVAAAQSNSAPNPTKARNVILFIGDGMGDSEITIARNYHIGAAGRLEMDALPHTGSVTTYSLQEKDPTKPNYVTDSAAGGTAWATGMKTSNGRISTAASTNAVLKTIVEMAQARGMRIGNVTTAELVDATPAVLASHISYRRCYGPKEMARCDKERKSQGGLGSIAEQLVDHKLDVMLGGGRKRFDAAIEGGPYDGQTVLQAATTLGYEIVTDAHTLAVAEKGKPLLGLFNDGNMSLEWSGDPAIPYPGSGPQRCKEFVRSIEEPSLASMTVKALQLLDSADGPGFFLQVEGAQIDKQDHVARPCEQIGETIGFDNAIKIGIDFEERHPDTLVIVTADHGHTSQIIPTSGEGAFDHPAGLMSTLTTADKASMTIGYATNVLCCATDHDMEHTGVQVRIAAMGPGAQQVSGLHDMTDVFHMIAKAIGLE